MLNIHFDNTGIPLFEYPSSEAKVVIFPPWSIAVLEGQILMMLGRSGDADGIILQPRQWVLDLHRGTLRLGDDGWVRRFSVQQSAAGSAGKGKSPNEMGI